MDDPETVAKLPLRVIGGLVLSGIAELICVLIEAIPVEWTFKTLLAKGGDGHLRFLWEIRGTVGTICGYETCEQRHEKALG
jgi:hypothetical protein